MQKTPRFFNFEGAHASNLENISAPWLCCSGRFIASFLELMVETCHPQVIGLVQGNPWTLGHAWILRDSIVSKIS